MKTKDNVENKAHSVDMKDLADSVNNVAKTTGAAVKGSVKTVGALAKTISFIFNNLPLVGIIIAVIVATWLFLFNPFGWNMNLFGKPQIENTANIVEEVKKIYLCFILFFVELLKYIYQTLILHWKKTIYLYV